MISEQEKKGWLANWWNKNDDNQVTLPIILIV